MNEFRQAAMDAGFNMKQIEFLEEHVAKYPHGHDATEIAGIEDVVADLLEEDEGEEE